MKKALILFFILSINLHVFSQTIDAQLVQAAYDGNEASVIDLLNQGANPNALDNNGYPALIYACAYGYEGIVEALLDKTAAINTKYNEVYPIFAAVRNDNKTTIQMLLDKGAYINVKDSEGYTPLMFAAQEGYAQTVQFLLNKGASIDTETNNGHTALSIAIQNDHKEVVEVLLARNPKKRGYSYKPHSPINTAKQANSSEYKKMLKQYGMKNIFGLPTFDYVTVGTGINFTPYDLMINYEAGIHETTYNFDIFGGYSKNTDSSLTRMRSDATTYAAVNTYYLAINKNLYLATIKNGRLGISAGGFYSGFAGWNRTTRQDAYQFLYGVNGSIFYRTNFLSARFNYNRILDDKSFFYTSRFNLTVRIKIFSFSNSNYSYADKTLWMI